MKNHKISRCKALMVLILFPICSICSQNILISQGGVVNVNGGEIFYDAGGPSGNDGNTDYIITLKPANAREGVCVDFTSFISHLIRDSPFTLTFLEDADRLEIYDGLSISSPNIGSLQGDYSGGYNTATIPEKSGQIAIGAMLAEFKPGKFCATNPDGALTFKFFNKRPETQDGWIGEVSTFELIPPGCNIDITASDNPICPGTTVTLSAVGTISSSVLNDFNAGTLGAGWTATNGTFSFLTQLSCEPNKNHTSINDNSLFVWIQNGFNTARQITSAGFDVSDGGLITFDMRLASDNNGANGCESPDSRDGIYLQYSTDNGMNWTTFKLIFPVDEFPTGYKGTGEYIFDWTKILQPIPVAAQTANTKFRWNQEHSDFTDDHWGIDNVEIITKVTSTLSITNLATGALLGTTADSTLDIDVTPTTTTTYRASITNGTGTETCFKDITINVSSGAIAGTDGGTTICDSSTSPIDLYSLITGEQSGGTWTQTTGTGGAFDASAGTFTPTAGSTSSTFTYTLAGTLTCVDYDSVASVNITAQANAGADGYTTICDGSTSTIDLYSLITGEQSGGTWTQTTGTGGTFDSAAGTFTPTPGATSSTFTYTLVGTSPCMEDSSLATVNITAQPDAGDDGTTTICDSSTAPIDLYSLITDEQTGGTWAQTTGTGGTFDASAGTFIPETGATSSTFTYTLAGTASCMEDSSLATVNITAQPDAGDDGTTTICDSSTAPIDLYSLITDEQTGGTWAQATGTGGTFDASAGTFTPETGATSSTFTYTLAGTASCMEDSSLATVNITAQPDAGDDGTTTICDSSTAPIDLYSLITGEQTGGTWAQATGTGGTFDASAGTFIPETGATSSTFTYTLAGTASCMEDSSLATVNITAQPDAGDDGTTTICDSSTAPIDLYSLITDEQTGGTWAQTTGTGGTFDASAGTFTPETGATSSTFTYTLAGTASCMEDSSLATVNITAQPDAGDDGTTTICDSSTAPIDLYSLITDEQTGGTWAQTTGTGGTFDASAGTFTPETGATSSTFTYTLAGTASCMEDSSLATVNITAQPDAGDDGTTTICDSSTAPIDLYSLITDEQTGGTWAQTTGTGGTFDASAGTFIPETGATSSTFTYTLAGTASCMEDSSLATVNITAQPDAGDDGTTTICDSSTAPIDLYSLITDEQTGGTWAQTTGTGGTFDASAGTFTPETGATSSTFTYTLAGTASCMEDSSLATVNITAQPDAGDDGTTTICDSSTAPIDLYSLITDEQTGGTWAQATGTGGTFDASAGTFTPETGATSSTFTYTLAGTASCMEDSSVATVNITAQPDAGDDGTTTICDSSTAPIDLYSLITDEQTGGTWAQTTGTGGTFDASAGTFIPETGATSSTFTYTLAGTASCMEDSSLATVNITAQPDAGDDGTTTICDSSTSSIDLYSLITGEQTGGTWAQATGTGGTFDATAGTFTPGTGVTNSTFTYTLAGTAQCMGDSSLATVNITAQPDAGTDGTTTICDSSTSPIDLYSLITGEQTGGTWAQATGTGGTFDATAGTFTPGTGVTNSTFTYTLAGTAQCMGDSSLATVNITAQPDAGTDGTTTICDSSTSSIDLYSLITGEQTGGTWAQATGTGGTFDATAGTFTPGTGVTNSTFTYTLAGTVQCMGDSSLATVNITAQPDAGTDGTTTICDSSTSSIDLYSLITGEQTGGTWAQATGTGGTFDATAGTFTPGTGVTNSTFTYTLAGTVQCMGDSSLATVNITAQPDAGTDGTTTICDSSTSSIDLYSLITGEQTGGTWAQATGTGGTFDATAGTFTPGTGVTNSTFTYTLAGTASCMGDSSLATVNITAQPDAGTDGTTTICDSSTSPIDLDSLITGEQTGGTWAQTTGTGGTFDAAAGTFTPETGATSSTFTYTLAGTAQCMGDSSLATVNITAQPDAGTDGTTTICDSSTAPIDLDSLITGEQTGGTWAQTTGTGGTFDAAAGTFTPETGVTNSTFTYTLAGTAQCMGDSSLATVNITAQPDAGTDGTTTICDSSTSSIDLYSLITGEQTGGTWAQATGTGGTFDATAGTFTPGTGVTNSTFTYTLAGTAQCMGDSSLATVNITAQPDAGTDGTTTICDSSTSPIDLYSLITDEQTGGTWAQTTGTGGTFDAAAGTFTPETGATSSTFTYTLAGTASCMGDSSLATVNITAQPDAGTDGTTTICDSSTSPIDLYSLITGEQTGGTWTRSTGTGGTFDAAAGTFTPGVGSTTSTFTYTLTGTASCTDDSSLATVNINEQLEAGANGNTTICDSDTSTIDLFSLITGEQTGGTWTRSTGTGGTFDAAAGTFTPGVGSTTSTFTYTLTGTASCTDDSSLATVNINEQLEAGANGNTTICDSDTSTIDLFSLITGEQTGGTWTRSTGTGGTFDAAAGTFTPDIGSTTSTFTYTLTGTAPCTDDSSLATVNINEQLEAGANGNTTICDSDTSTIDLFSLITGEQTGGTWTRSTGTGGTFDAAAGTFTPGVGSTTSTFTYTLTGTASCTDDSSLATVNINEQLEAGANGNTTICDSDTSTIDLFSLITGEQTGGTWTRSTGTGGTFDAAAGTFTPGVGSTTSTFTYTLTGTAPCTDDSSLATVNINEQLEAGANGNTTICDSDTSTIDLFSLITGEQTGGTWTRSTGTGGTFDAAAGTFTPGIGSTTSTFTYTLTGTAPCTDDSSLATVNINEQLEAGANGNTTICDSDTNTIDLFSLITGEQTGGTWTRSTGTGGTFDAAAGTFTPGVGSTTSTFTYTLTGTASCTDDSSLATVNINEQLEAGANGNTTICDSDTNTIDLFSLITGEQTGGTWTRSTGTGGTFDAAAGTFTPGVGSTTSTFTYTLTGTAPCTDDSSLATVNINEQLEAGANGNTTICDSDTSTIDLFSLITGEQTGGTWTRSTGTGGTFDAAAGTFTPGIGSTTSTFTYTLTGTAPCTDDSSLATVNINEQLEAGANGNTTICDSDTNTIDLFSLITGEQTGGTWTRSTGTGGTFDAAAGTFTPGVGSTTSTFTYTLTGTASCTDDSSLATVNINEQLEAGANGNTTICDSDTNTIDLFSLITGEQTGGTWTRSTGTGGTFDAAAGTFTPGVGSTTSTFTYTLTGTAPCTDDSSLATVNINEQLEAGANGNTTICDSDTSTIDLFSLITGEQTGGTWTRSTGTGGTFDAAAGTFTLTPGSTSSTFTYTLTGTAPCTDDSSLATVNINEQLEAGANGNTTICDSDTNTIDLFSLITGEQTGGTWTRSTGTGGTFDAAAGTFTPGVGSTTSTFTYTLTGTASCTDDSSLATVNINEQLEAGANGNTTICDSDTNTIDLFSLITGEQTGGTWAQTTGTGGTFDAAAGTFTPETGATSSTFTYTLEGTASCMGDSSLATVNINAQPDAGADGATAICDSSTSPIDLYSLITGEQTGGTWTQTTGTGGAFDASAGTFTPETGATSSTFTYTLAGTASCMEDSSLATVNITAQPDAGDDGTTTICDSSTAPIDLYSLITDEQTGGTWAQTTGTGGTFDASAGTFIPETGATSSTFTYTLAGTASCMEDSSLATVNITAQPDAGDDGTTTICDSSTAPIDLYSLITDEQTGGTWAQTTGTGGTFDASAGTFTPETGATSSTFTYTLAGTASCMEDSSLATVNITAQPDAGDDGTTTICDSSTAPIDLYSLITDEQTGGTWAQTTGTGGTFDASAGTFIPETGATSSTFTYTLAGTASCMEDSSLATVNITAQPDAGDDGTTTICDSSTAPIDLYSLITDEQTGGTWAQTTGTGGTFDASAGTFTPETGATSSTFTYTLAGTASCMEDSSLATVNITAQPDAGTDGATAICDSSTSPIDLYSLITGEQTGGTWAQTTGTGGFFDASAGTFTPETGATSSTFTYVLVGTAPCSDDSSLATVNITAQPDAGTDGATTICDSSAATIDLYSLITGEQTGGAWAQTTGTGGFFDASAGTFTPATGATSSTFTYSLVGTAPCSDDSSLATVNITAQPDAGTDGATTICDSSTATIDLYSLITGEQTGGTWTRTTGTGGAFDASAGTFTPATGATSSTFTYSLVGTAPCSDDSSMVIITINQQPIITGDFVICIDDSTDLGVSNFEGVWSSLDDSIASVSSEGVVTGISSGTTDITFTSMDGCSDSVLFTVDGGFETSAPDALEYCDPDNDGFGVFTLTDANAQITGGASGLDVTYHLTMIDAENNVNALSSPYNNVTANMQTVYVRVESASMSNGCASFEELVLIVHPTPAIVDPTPFEICDDDTADGFATFDLRTKEAEILNGLDSALYPVTYYLEEADANVPQNQIGSPSAFQNTDPYNQTVWVRVEDNITGCFKVTSLELVVNALPVLVQPDPLTLCDYNNPGDEIEVFTLEDANAQILNGQTGITLSYYNTQANAEIGDGTGQLFSPYTNSMNPETIYVRGENDVTGCWDFVILDLRVAPLPSPATPADYEVCDDDNDGYAEFDLSSQSTAIENGEPDITITYHLTEADANSGENALPNNYNNGTQNMQVIYVRAENTGATPGTGTGCYTVVELTLIVLPAPVIPVTLPDYVICDEDTDGYAQFDFDTVMDPQIYGTQDPADFILSYHTTQAAAETGNNPIPNTSNYTNQTQWTEDIYIHLESIANGCITTRMFTIRVVTAPEVNPAYDHTLTSCDDLDENYQEINDGFTSFNLTSEDLEITNGEPSWSVTYYETQADAEAGINAIDPATDYTNIDQGVQTIIAEVTDTDTGCSSFTTVTLQVLPNPSPSPDPENLELCDDNNSGDMIEIFDLTENEAYILNNEDGVTLSYYTSQDDAIMGTNAIADPTQHSNEDPDNLGTGITPQTIYVRAENTGTTGVPATGCYSLVNFDVIVNPLPVVPDAIEGLLHCEINNDGTYDDFGFDLESQTDLILNGQDATIFTVTYHENQMDADTGANALLSPYENIMNPQIIYVNVTNTETGCTISTLNFTIEVQEGALANQNLATYEICDDNMEFDGDTTNDMAEFDLSTQNALALDGQDSNNYTVSYYASQADADAGINSLPLLYTNSINPQTIIVRVDNSSSLCYETAELILQVNPMPAFNLEDSYVLCVNVNGTEVINVPVIATGLNATDYSFEWSIGGGVIPGETGPSITPIQGGEYSVVVTDVVTGCSTGPTDPNTITQVKESQPPTIEVEQSTLAFADQNNISVQVTNITPGNIGVYEFNIDGSEWVSNTPNNAMYLFEDVEEGEHTIKARDINGCGETTLLITIIDYPHYFTPNNDRYHDVWNINGLSSQLDAKIYIFDRFGKLLKQISPAGNGWDGTHNGELMPASDYWFTLEYREPNTTENIKKIFKSHFSLRR